MAPRRVLWGPHMPPKHFLPWSSRHCGCWFPEGPAHSLSGPGSGLQWRWGGLGCLPNPFLLGLQKINTHILLVTELGVKGMTTLYTSALSFEILA